jgi:hypothetical protein
MFHRMAHMLQQQKGVVVSAIVEGKTSIGFKCSTCGKVEGMLCVEDIINDELGLK